MELTHTQILYYAFLQGLVGGLNPCGFAMLLGYLSLVVLGEDTKEAGKQSLSSVLRALMATAAMAVGFVAVFGAFGLLSESLSWRVQRYLPFATMAVGIMLALLGLLLLWRLLRGGEAVIRLPQWPGKAPTARISSMFGYGIAYAVSSLSCGFGSFVTVISLTFQTGASNLGLLACLAYAGGMTVVVGSLAMSTALAHNIAAVALRAVLPYISRISAVLVVATGLYVAYYGWYEYRLFHANASPDNSVISSALALESWLGSAVNAFSSWQWAVILLALLAFAGVWTVFVGLWRPRPPAPEPPPAPGV